MRPLSVPLTAREREAVEAVISWSRRHDGVRDPIDDRAVKAFVQGKVSGYLEEYFEENGGEVVVTAEYRFERTAGTVDLRNLLAARFRKRAID